MKRAKRTCRFARNSLPHSDPTSASGSPAARVFTLPKDFRAAAMLRADLTAADIPYEDNAGRVVDFHSLRVTFATNLARGDVALQLAQRLLRHSTPVAACAAAVLVGY